MTAPRPHARHGGKILIECLQALGARHSFGVPGESYLAALDALHDTQGALDFTLCRNEGGAAFMAAAYGKLTRTPGICFVTRGPGATNASIGVHTAMQDSSPMILFVGQVGTDMIGREAFQEIDYTAYFGSVAKWVTQINDLDRMPELVARAWTTALSGRPGPVVVALPENILSAQSDVPALSKPPVIPRPAPGADAVKKAQTLLSAAKRPLLLIGGGSWHPDGQAALQQFAEASEIPTLAGFRFQDLIDNNSPAYAGDAGVGMTPAVKSLIRDADVICTIGLRFGEMLADGYSLLQVPEADQTLIHVHPSDRELGKVYQADLPIHADPNLFAQALSPVTGPWSDWAQAARQSYIDAQSLPPQPQGVDMGAVVKHLQSALPPDAVLTNGAGNFATWHSRFFLYGPNHRLLAPQAGAMGYGIPAAIATKVASPERTVLCIAGDGDFQMNCQELGTAMQAGAQPIILIVNNGSYGTIRMHQERTYPNRVAGTDLENPDFTALARAYGFHAERVETTDDFAPALHRALASETGAVLDLNVTVEALTPRQTLTDIKSAAS